MNKKILFLSDFFPPEVNAPATRTFEHLREWVNIGYSPIVLTSVPNFPKGRVFEGYKNRLLQKEIVEGIKVLRVWTFIYPNTGFVWRILDQISYMASSFVVGLFIRTDIIVATSPNFFGACSAYLLAAIRRKPWIMEVRDIWPESIMAVGAMNDGFIYRILEWIELRLYKSANKIIVVTDAFKENISSRGIDSAKIYVHKNGVNLEIYQPREKDKELIESYPQLSGKMVFAYIGTHGMAHGLSFILSSLVKVQEILPQAHFLFIGEGAEKKSLLNQANVLNLENVTFIPFVPKQEVVRYLSLMDIALVNLKKHDTFKTVIPSKIFEAAALQKPILVGLEGETKEIIEYFNAGICFEPENEEDFIKQCQAVLNERLYCEFQKGCEKLAAAYDRKQIARQVLETITTNG